VRLKYLRASMKRHGWIDAYPMHVIRENGKLVVKGGHHRFVVAKELGIPVKYAICNDEATIHELERSSVPWRVPDYLASMSRAGEASYAIVKEYCEKTWIPISLAISMLANQTAGSHNYDDKFKDGTYVVAKDRTHAETVGDLVVFLRNQGINYSHNQFIVRALSRLVWIPEFSAERLKQKVKSHKSFIQKPANLQNCMLMIETIYNRASKTKVPLTFLADEAAKQRNVINKSKAASKAEVEDATGNAKHDEETTTIPSWMLSEDFADHRSVSHQI
jgi:hypothetical protein